ncbi:MAG: hypothetical protein ACE5LU_26660 [Anaerolineae bacterium]
MRHRRHRFFGFPFRTFWGPGEFGFFMGTSPFFGHPFRRRKEYIQWLEEYKRDLEEYKREIEEELAEVEQELVDLRREEP